MADVKIRLQSAAAGTEVVTLLDQTANLIYVVEFDGTFGSGAGEYTVGANPWEIFGPDGSDDTFDAGGGAGDTGDGKLFTPAYPGRYLFRLTATLVGGSSAKYTSLLEISDPHVIGEPGLAPGIHRNTSFPAANESGEYDPDEGWARPVERYFRAVSELYAGNRMFVALTGGTAITQATVASITDLEKWKGSTASLTKFNNFVHKVTPAGEIADLTGDALVLAMETVAAGSRGKFFAQGLLPFDTNTHFAGASVGDSVYVTTTGSLTKTKAASTGRVVGTIMRMGADTDTNPGLLNFDGLTGSLPTAGQMNVGASTDNAMTRWDGTTGAAIQDSPNGPFALDSGWLGIGVVSPVRALNIVTNQNEVVQLENTQIGGDCSINYRTTDGADINWATGIRGSDDSFRIANNVNVGTNDRFVIDINGAVGIGTAIPEGILHTAHNSGVNIFQRSNNSAAYGTNFFVRKSRGTVGSEADVQSGDMLGQMSFSPYFGDYDNQAASIAASVEGTLGADTTPGRLTFSTTRAGANTVTEAMRITSEGRVGIGTTTPEHALHVEGALKVTEIIDPKGLAFDPQTSNPGTSYSLQDNTLWQSSTTSYSGTSIGKLIFAGKPLILNGGDDYVGIGITSPRSALDVVETITDGSSQIVFSEGHPDPTVAGCVGYEDTGSTRAFIANKYSDNAATFGIRMKGAAASNEVVTVLGSGNVGIGTTSPTEELDVVGDIGVSNNLIVQNGVGIGAASPSSKLHVEKDGAGALPSIDNDTLAIFQRNLPGSASAAITIIGHVGGESIIKLGDSDDEDIGRIRYRHTDNSLGLFTNNSEALHIDLSGNVGIGTTAPSELLHVAGNLKVDGDIDFRASASSTRRTLVANTATTRAGVGKTATEDPRASLEIASTTADNTANIAHIRLSYTEDVTDGSGNVTTPGVYAELRTTSSGHLLLSSTGTRVGIGTTSPDELVHLKSAGTNPTLKIESSTVSEVTRLSFANDRSAAGDIASLIQTYNNGASPITDIRGLRGSTDVKGVLTFFTSDSEHMRIDEDGNVGIGTTTPDEKLHIDGSSAKLKITDPAYNGGVTVFTEIGTPHIHLKANGSTASGGISFRDNVDNQEWAIATNTVATTGLEFIDGANTVVLNLAHGGNVGIGTTAPSEKLSVSGSIDVSSSSAYKIGGTSVLSGATLGSQITGSSLTSVGTLAVLAVSGNVGAGTTAPGYRFHAVDTNNVLVQLDNTWNGGDCAINYRTSYGTDVNWATGIKGSDDTFRISNYSSVGTNDHIVITTSGNVGIGTTSPASGYKLDINGDTKISGTVYLSEEQSTSPSPPANGDGGILYTKADGKIYWASNDLGADIDLTAGGGGGSGITSLTLAGDGGTSQAITNGNTINIAGGTGIDTVAGATDTVTVSVDNTVATLAGQQILTNKTINLPTIGGMKFGSIHSITANYTCDTRSGIYDDVIFCDVSGGALTITLPAVSSGRTLMIKDKEGSCSSSNYIRLTPASGTIDGSSSRDLDDTYVAVTLISDGTNWLII